MSTINDDFMPLNEDYGEGVYRRRIRLRGHKNSVVAELEDIAHGFRVIVEHDGWQVTRLLPEVIRVPFSTCSGAVTPLQALLGTVIDSSAATIIKQSDIASNCTHLFDLAILAIAHCRRGVGERVWDIAVPDQPVTGEAVAVSASLNGQSLLTWEVADWALSGPEALRGNTLFRGFNAWASALYTDDLAEAAFALQKGYFVAQARRYESSALGSARHDAIMQGVCHTYSPAIVAAAVRLPGTLKDFTDSPEQLLKFQ